MVYNSRSADVVGTTAYTVADPGLRPVGAANGAGAILTPDLCVIGAGSGGLSMAAAAASLGVSVVLVERYKMGGDCLNAGCVPSKALIAAAKRAHLMRTSEPFGIAAVQPTVDYAAVRRHIAEVIAAIAPNDSVARFTALGVHVIQASGRFIDLRTLEAGDTRIRARRFVIATGSSPAVPPIPGLDRVPFLTNESVFDIDQPVGHLVVIGAGPIGMELAQAHRRLGARVTVLEAGVPLAKDDPELTRPVLRALRVEGIDIRAGASIKDVSTNRQGLIAVRFDDGNGVTTVEATHLLVAAGRRPNIDGLGLDLVRVKAGPKGIQVNAGMVTTNRRIFAIGDVTGGLQFTHVANDQAGIVIRRALFRLPAKARLTHIPWVTFTDPEIAQVGLSEEQARKAHGTINVYRWPLHENDRAQAERETHGLIKVVCDKKGYILGAGIVGADAGELIHIWSLAIAQRLKISAMTSYVVPYPTRGEISKRAAFIPLAAQARNPRVRKLLAFLARFG